MSPVAPVCEHSTTGTFGIATRPQDSAKTPTVTSMPTSSMIWRLLVSSLKPYQSLSLGKYENERESNAATADTRKSAVIVIAPTAPHAQREQAARNVDDTGTAQGRLFFHAGTAWGKQSS